MAKGIMHVQTGPASPEAAAAYHVWYESHLREIATVDGVTAARRFGPLDGNGRFLAIYELEADDVAAVAARISATSSQRTPPPPGVLQTDPPPTVVYYEEISTFTK